MIQDNTPAIPPAIISLLNCITLESRSLLGISPRGWSPFRPTKTLRSLGSGRTRPKKILKIWKWVWPVRTQTVWVNPSGPSVPGHYVVTLSYNWAVWESNYFHKSKSHKQEHHDKWLHRHHDRFQSFHVGWIFSWHMPFWKGHYCSSPFLIKVNHDCNRGFTRWSTVVISWLRVTYSDILRLLVWTWSWVFTNSTGVMIMLLKLVSSFFPVPHYSRRRSNLD